MIDIPSDNINRLGFEVNSGVTFFIKGALANNVKRVFYSVPPVAVKESVKGYSEYLGTPIMTNITFGNPGPDKASPQINHYKNIDGSTWDYSPITLELVLMTVSTTKNIVKTPIQGRKGTIKEFVSDGDYLIEIKGIISDKDNHYPHSIIQELIQICEIPSEIPVISDYLTMFGIYDCVIESYHFPQEEGFNSQQEFTISMISDFPIQLDSIESDPPQQGQKVLIDSNITVDSANYA